MNFKIEFTKIAVKDFNSLNEKDKIFISLLLDKLKANPFSGSVDIKKLKTPFEGYRARKGSFRILIIIEHKLITVYSVKRRKDVYR